MDLDNEAIRWLLAHGAQLLIGAVVLLLIYRVGVSAIHRSCLPSSTRRQRTSRPGRSEDEVGKRIRTIEDLLLKLLRVGVLAGFVVVVLAVFELYTILAAIVLLIVAVVFATRDVVLDYVMGFLILMEGPYFNGDYVVVSGHPGVEGVVEEIGLRRTVLRDGLGSSHAVSNAYIRTSSNLTRLFSVAVVDLHVLHAADFDRALAIAARVAGEMRADAAWVDSFVADAPTDSGSPGSGWTARRSGSSSGSRPVPRWSSRASFAGGWLRPSWRCRSGRADGTRRCRSSPSRAPHDLRNGPMTAAADHCRSRAMGATFGAFTESLPRARRMARIRRMRRPRARGLSLSHVPPRCSGSSTSYSALASSSSRRGADSSRRAAVACRSRASRIALPRSLIGHRNSRCTSSRSGASGGASDDTSRGDCTHRAAPRGHRSSDPCQCVSRRAGSRWRLR